MFFVMAADRCMFFLRVSKHDTQLKRHYRSCVYKMMCMLKLTVAFGMGNWKMYVKFQCFRVDQDRIMQVKQFSCDQAEQNK